MSRIVAVTGEDPAYGFSLVGVETVACSHTNEALAAIRSAGTDVGIVIVEQRFLEEFDPRTRKELETQIKPLVVSVPFSMVWSPAPGLQGDDLIARLIRQAVGYQLNIHL